MRRSARRRPAAVTAGPALAALALPSPAAAHRRSAIVALAYRLRVDAATRALPGVRVQVLDGDRGFPVSVGPGVTLVVRGELDDPLPRTDAGGVWVPTATSDSLIDPHLRGRVHVSGSRTVVWHDRRLAPPPTSRAGPDGGFSIPVVLVRGPATIAGSVYRVARPARWPWRAGLAALVAVAASAARDAPTGSVGWLEIGTGRVLADVPGGLFVALRGRARIHAAGLVGAVGAAVSLSATPAFYHGGVIAALPAAVARLACGLALALGVAAAALSFLRDFDAPLRPARR